MSRTLIFLTLIITALLATACGQEAEKLNQEGNEAFAKAAYAEALASYESAQVENPDLAEPYYNTANTLYREGAYSEALLLLQEALKYADAELLEQNSLYNQGNSAYNLEQWESAIAAYTEALLRNPDDQEAKYNLELALRQMLEQQQEQQENQEEQEEQEQAESQQDESETGQQEQEENQQQDQSQEEEQENQQSSGEEQEEEQNSGQGQAQENEEQQESQSQMPLPGQRMTPEQARQLLEAIAQDTETLQERLGQIFVAPPLPPTQDW